MTCEDCILPANASDPEGSGLKDRDWCGWCHLNITYLKDGSKGPRCADIRDDPWNCPDLFDTFKCL